MIYLDLEIFLRLPLVNQIEIIKKSDNATVIAKELDERELSKSHDIIYRKCAEFGTVFNIGLLDAEQGLNQLKKGLYNHVVQYNLPDSHIKFINSFSKKERMRLKHTFFEKYLDEPIEYVHHRTFGEFVRNYNKNEIYGYQVEYEDYTDFLYQKELTEGEPVMMLTDIELQSSVDVDYDEYAFETNLEISFFNTKQEAFNALETRISEMYKEEYDSSYASFMKNR